MSHARDTYDKKHGRRVAGSFGPPRKHLKKESSKSIRHKVKHDLKDIEFSFLEELGSASPEVARAIWELVEDQ